MGCQVLLNNNITVPGRVFPVAFAAEFTTRWFYNIPGFACFGVLRAGAMTGFTVDRAVPVFRFNILYVLVAVVAGILPGIMYREKGILLKGGSAVKSILPE